jgi:hypothetical protein
MSNEMSRRGVLAGLGAATGAAAIGLAAPTAGAAATRRDGDGGFPPFVGQSEGKLTTSAPPLVEGLSYRVIDPSAFDALGTGGASGRTVTANQGVTPSAPPDTLVAPIDVPVGAVIKEFTVSYVSPAAAVGFVVYKKSFEAQYNLLTSASLPAGAGYLTRTLGVDEPVDGNGSYMAFAASLAAGQFIGGLRVGYVPPPQAFVPISPVNRVLDTRLSGGKLAANEERTVPLGVPSFAKAAVVNLTVTDTEGAGFVAVFPANVAWPGNSSINWSETGQNLANGVITATDAIGNVKIRGGVAPTHVVIDVQGYLL